VERRVAAGGLTDTTLVVPFEGRVEPYLKALDAFVLPSYWEGMPIAVLEAMAMGLPVVASAVDGTPEAIEEGVTGYLVPAHDPGALADRLQAVAADPAGRARIGEAARAEAQRRFGVERMVARIESLYERVVGR
jgi:glycosyltransferase involved in cell wall biosynthesis